MNDNDWLEQWLDERCEDMSQDEIRTTVQVINILRERHGLEPLDDLGYIFKMQDAWVASGAADRWAAEEVARIIRGE